MSEVEKALETYYSMKLEYDKKRSALKTRILKDTMLSSDDKKKRIAEIKVTCVKCKRKVGMNFTQNKRTIQVICGDKLKPCGLDIKIYLGIYRDMEGEMALQTHRLDMMKVDIIKSKLEILFRLSSEERNLELFQTQKKTYNAIEKQLLRLENMRYRMVQPVIRAEQIKSLTYELHEKIALFKNLLKEYTNKNHQSFLQDAILMYQEDIVPLEESIRKNKYMLSEIEETDGGHFRLVQETETVNNKEFVVKPAKVITFKI